MHREMQENHARRDEARKCVFREMRRGFLLCAHEVTSDSDDVSSICVHIKVNAAQIRVLGQSEEISNAPRVKGYHTALLRPGAAVEESFLLWKVPNCLK